jgi:hypothetical protein
VHFISVFNDQKTNKDGVLHNGAGEAIDDYVKRTVPEKKKTKKKSDRVLRYTNWRLVTAT